MSNRLDAIRAYITSKENNGGGNRQSGGGDNAMFPFWNTPVNETSTLRFLPDGNVDNPVFWVERLRINLTFNGIKGQDHKPVTVSVPCMEMFEGGVCPILSEIRPWFKDPELSDLARKYWKKKSYLFQGFVVDTPIKEENLPENPIRRFAINTSIFEKIKASLMSTDFEDTPTDYEGGRDFRLTKTQKGQYANYDTSSWAFRTRALTDEELGAIEKYKLSNLSDMLPKRPTDEEVQVIAEMFKDSVEDNAYDLEKYGNYFRPYGVQAPASSSSSSTPVFNVSKQEKVAEAKEEPKEEVPASSESSDEVSDIIARIRANRK